MESQIKGQPVHLKIQFGDKFSLDEQDPEKKHMMDKILNYINVIIRRTLFEHKYNQVGRNPRFFLAAD